MKVTRLVLTELYIPALKLIQKDALDIISPIYFYHNNISKHNHVEVIEKICKVPNYRLLTTVNNIVPDKESKVRKLREDAYIIEEEIQSVYKTLVDLHYFNNVEILKENIPSSMVSFDLINIKNKKLPYIPQTTLHRYKHNLSVMEDRLTRNLLGVI